MDIATARPSKPVKVLAVFAAIFGIMTVFSGGSVLFGPDTARAMAGNYLSFVVWFNFLAGFLYLAAAAGAWTGRGWAFGLALLIALATGLVAVVFAYRIGQGAAFETRTIGALVLRTGFWTVSAMILRPAGRAA